jgi:hypothetical protein
MSPLQWPTWLVILAALCWAGVATYLEVHFAGTTLRRLGPTGLHGFAFAPGSYLRWLVLVIGPPAFLVYLRWRQAHP